MAIERPPCHAPRLSPPRKPQPNRHKDIRQVQLAKGALLSGVHALFEQAGLTLPAIDRVLI